MKIGILTYHRAHNYGALLQAIGLRTALIELGHEAFFIDYYPEYHRSMYKPLTWKKFWRTPHSQKIKYLLNYRCRKERLRKFDTFIESQIAPYCKPIDEYFDTIVYGSDQIWRKQDNTKDFNPIYFGLNDFKTHKNISYAASMGTIALSSCEEEKLRSYLTNLNSISVREEQLCNTLSEIGVADVQTVIDPTFLISAKKWKQIINVQSCYSREYVLVYDLIYGSFDYNAIKNFAEKNQYDIISITGSATRKPTYNTRTTSDPFEFLDLIKNASFVFTSSFHGLAFSLIFEKDFYAAFKRNAERGRNLLQKVGLEDRLLSTGDPFIPESSKIDYSNVCSRLEEFKEKSLQFLKTSL